MPFPQLENCFCFYIQSIKYGKIDMVYEGLTADLAQNDGLQPPICELFGRRQTMAFCAISPWANGLCKPDLKVYKPPHIEDKGIPGKGCKNR
ncbi:hypothetical protein V7799_05550 [Rhizobium laguerreae]